MTRVVARMSRVRVLVVIFVAVLSILPAGQAGPSTAAARELPIAGTDAQGVHRPDSGGVPELTADTLQAVRTAGQRAAAERQQLVTDRVTKGILEPLRVLQQPACLSGACVQIAPRLASFDSTRGQLSNFLLGQLLDSNINLTVADFNGLLNGQINALELLQVLQANLGLATPEQALTTPITIAQLVSAAITVAQNDGNLVLVSALQDLLLQVTLLPGTIELGDLLQTSLVDGSLASLNLNALDLITGSAELFNSENVLTTPTPINITAAPLLGALGLGGLVNGIALQLQVIEPPIITCGPVGTQFYSASFRIHLAVDLVDVTLGLPPILGITTASITVGQFDLYLDIARASGTITAVDAIAQTVSISAIPGVVDIYLGTISPALFFNRTHVIDPNTDLQYGTIASLTVTIPILGTATLDVNARAFAEGTAPSATILNFTGPYPETQTVFTSATFITQLLADLATSLDIQLQFVGPVPPLLQLAINALVPVLLAAIRPLILNVLNPVLTPILANLIDPLLETLGIRLGEADVTVLAVGQLCPDLVVTKTASVDPAVAGDDMSFRVAVRNDGIVTAHNVMIVDTLPAPFTYLFDTDSCVEGPTDTLTCSLGDIPSGGSTFFDVFVHIEPDTAQGPYTNTAVASADEGEIDPSDNTGTSTIGVITRADLRVQKTASPSGTVPAGQQITYTVDVDNLGLSTATGVVLADTITSNGLFDLVSVSSNRPATCAPTSAPNVGSQAINCTLTGPLEPVGGAPPNDGRWTITIVVVANQAQSITNTATGTSSVTDPDPSNNTDVVASDVTAVADLSVTKTGPATVNAGSNMVYTINVANGGPSTAPNVVVADDLPAGTTYISAVPSAGSCALVPTNRVECALGGIASGGNASVVITVHVDATVPAGTILTNSATVTSDAPDPDNSGNTDTTTTTVTATSAISILKTDDPDPVAAGQIVEYKIVVTNTGPSVARNYRLVDGHGASLSFLTFSSATASPSGSCVFSGVDMGVRCTLGDLPVGQVYTIYTRWVVNASTPNGTVVSDTVTQFADSPVTVAGGSDVSESTTVAAVSDIDVDKVATPAVVVAGQIIKFSVAVTNHGPSDAPNVVVTDALPGGLDFLSDTDSCVEGPPNVLTCSLGTITSGGVTTFDIYAQVLATALPGTYTNNALGSSGNADPNGGNNTGSAEYTVGASADLRVTKLASPAGPVPAGQQIIYTIYVDNLGPSTATGVSMSDAITSNGSFTLDSIASDRPATCTPTPPVVNNSVNVNCALLGGLEPPALGTARWTITIALTANGAQTINNVASATSNTPDPDPSNNQATQSRDITDVADLVMVKSLVGGPVVAGGTATFSLQVLNNGPSTAHNVVVMDTLDPRFTFLSSVTSQGSCGAVGQSFGCVLGTIAPLGVVNITLTVKVDPGVPNGTVIQNTATVRSDDPDPDNTNSTDTVDVPVGANANLTLNKSDSVDPVLAGNLLVYTIDVTNLGPSSAAGATVNDALPAQVTFISAAVLNGACVYNGGTNVVTCALGTLAPGESRQILVTVQVKAGTPPGIIINIAQANSGTPDLAPGNNTDLETTTVMVQADLRIQKSATPVVVNAGGIVKYTITVFNDGPSNVPAAIVTDPLPLGMSYLADTDSCVQGPPGFLTCNLGPLAAGASTSFDVFVQVSPIVSPGTTLTNFATVAGPGVPDPNPGNNTTPGTDVYVVGSANLRMMKLVAPAGPVLAGQQVQYTLVVDNFGPSAATGVVIQDAITSNGLFSVLSINPDLDGNRPTASCAPPPAANVPSFNLTCNLNAGALEPVGVGGTGRWRVRVVVQANSPQTLNNVAVVTSNAADPDPSDNTASTTSKVSAVADLSVAKSDSPGTVVAGNNVTYSILVSNAGPSAATNVVVTDTLPPLVTVVSATVPGGSCTVSAGVVTCSLGTIPSGGNRTVTIVVTVDPSTNPGVIADTATARSDAFDPDNGNSSDTETTNVIALANLSIAKTDAPDPVTAGSSLTYNLLVRNAGPSTAHNVTVVDALPNEVTFASASVPGGSCIYLAGPHNVGCNLGDLPPMGPLEFRIITINVVVKADTPDGATLTNNAVVVANTLDPTPGNNTAAASTDVQASADLSMTKTAFPGTATAGEIVRYTLSVHNAGPSDATNVVVTDVLPAGVTFLHDTDSCAEGPPGTLTCTLGTVAAGTTTTFDVFVRIDADAAPGTHTNSASVGSDTDDPDDGDDDASVPITVLASADLRILKTAVPTGTVAAGQNLVYTIYVDNLGPSASAGVVVTDALTASGPFDLVSVVSDRPALCAPTAAPGVATIDVTCRLGAPLEPIGVGGNGRWRIVITVRATQAMSIHDVAHVSASTPDLRTRNNVDEESRDVAAVADLSILKSDSPDPVVAGGLLTYGLAIANAGPSTAANVIVTDFLPPGVTLVSAAVDVPFTGSCAAPAGQVVCSLGNMGPATGASITIVVRVNADTPSGTTLTNSAVVDTGNPGNLGIGGSPGAMAGGEAESAAAAVDADDADDADATGDATAGAQALAQLNNAVLDPNTNNNFDIEQTQVVASADMSISKTDGPDPVLAGNVLSYQLVVVNGGPSVATNVFVDDPLPVGTTFLSAAVVGGTCAHSAGPNVVHCDLPVVGASTARIITINVRVNANVPAGTILTNGASVSPGAFAIDPNPANNGAAVQTTVLAAADLEIDKTASGSGVPGSEILYTFTVTNHGPSDAQNVQVIDALPPGVTFVWDDDGCAGGGSPCSLGTVASGQTRTFHIAVQIGVGTVGVLSNLGIVTSTTPDPNPANNTDRAVITARPTADLSIKKYGVPGAVHVGQPTTYALVVDNFGPGAATGVTVVDNFVSDGAFDVTAITGAACAPGPGSFVGGAAQTCTIGTLLPFEQRIIRFTVVPRSGSKLTDVARVTSAADDPDLSNNIDDASTDIAEVSDLAVTKTSAATPSPLVAGGTIEYTVQVRNNGPNDAHGIAIIDRLPPGIVVTGFTASTSSEDRISCTTGAAGSAIDPLRCAVGTLPSGDTATVVITASVDPNLPAGTVLENDVYVTSQSLDTDGGDNRATTLDTVTNSADLSVAKFGNPGPVPAGTITSYDIVYSNAGPSTAHRVILTDVLPPNVDPISVFVIDGSPAADSATCHIRTGDPALVGSVTCELGDIAPGQSGRAVVTVRVRPTAPAGVVTNNVNITSSTPDPAGGNNNASFNTTIALSADLAVEKAALNGPPVAGTDITYRVTVRNLGPSAAAGVTVVDTYSPNLTYLFDTDSCAPSGVNQITCAVGTLQPGDVASFDVTFHVANNAAGQNATNSVTVSAPGIVDPNPANNGDTAGPLPIGGLSDLRLAKLGKPDGVVRAGDTLNYTLIVQNFGPSDATGVQVIDTLVSDGTYAVVSVTGATCAPPPGNFSGTTVFTCTLPGTLPAFGQATVLMSVRALAARSIDNAATVTSPNRDPDVSNNHALVEHDVTQVGDLRVTKTAAPATAVPGQAIVWTLNVTNNGPSTAENVELVDRLPAGIIVTGYTAVRPGGGVASCSTGAAGSAIDPFKCGLGTLLTGQTAVVTITATVDPNVSTGFVLENDAYVASDAFDVNNADNRTSTLTPVAASADLAIAKSAAPSPATAGGPLQYTLTVTNLGPSTARNVVVADTLPAGVTFGGATVVGIVGGSCAPVPAGSVTCQLGDLPPGQIVRIYVNTTVNPGFAGVLANSAGVSSTTADPVPANNIAGPVNVTVNASADLSIDKTASSFVVVPGENFRYRISVRNAGPSDAANVQVLDTLPAGMAFVASSASCTAVGPNVTCALGTVLAGQTVTFDIEVAVAASVADNITLTNNARVTSTTTDPVAGNNADTAPVVTNRVADLAVRKFGKPDGAVRTGQDLTYSILVDNFGPSDAGGVVIQELIKADAGFEFRSVTGATCVPAPIVAASQSLTLACTVGTIPAGTTAQVTIVLRSTTSLSINNVATARSADAFDPDPSDNTGYVEHDIVLLSDVSITKTASGEVVNAGPANCALATTATANTVTAGRNLTYVLTVTNNGPNAAENVLAKDRLPAGVTVLSTAVSGGGTCTVGGGEVSCGLDGMAVAAVKTITIVTRTDPNLASGAVLTNDATVSSAVLDANNANNFASNNTTVGTAADLAITKSAEPASAVAGQTIVQYTLTVANNGPSVARGVTVVDTLPAGLTFVSTSGAVCRQNPANLQQITCQLGDLPPATSAQVFLVARVNADVAPGSVANTAGVASATADPCAANNTSAPANVPVTRTADVYVFKTAVTDPAVAGGEIRYRVRFGNLGPSTATSVRIEDLLPQGIVFNRCESIDPNDEALCSVVSGDGLNVRHTVRLTSIKLTNVIRFSDLGSLNAATEFTFDIVGRIAAGYVLDGRGDGDPGEVCAAYGAAFGYTAFGHDRATITSAQDSGLTGNNFDDVCTRINGSADLAIEKTVGIGGCDAALIGAPVLYNLIVRNLGPSDAAKVIVEDLLPFAIDAGSVQVTAPSGVLVGVNPLTNIVTIIAGNDNGQSGRINAGGTVSIGITAAFKESDIDLIVTNVGNVYTVQDNATWPGGRTPTADPALSNNTARVTHQALNLTGKLEVDKTVSLTGQCPGVDVPVMVGPGQPLTYCIDVRNSGSLSVLPGARITDTLTSKLGKRIVFSQVIDTAIDPGQTVHFKLTDRIDAAACGSTVNDVVVTGQLRIVGANEACLLDVAVADSATIMVPCTDGAVGADTRIGLPIINGPGDPTCSTWIQIQNLGCANSKAMVVFWGDAGACPPQAAGPLKVECTGLLRPGSAWSLLAEGSQLPAGAKSGIVYSMNADDIVKSPPGFDLPFADMACQYLFDTIVGSAVNWAGFDQAYRSLGTFQYQINDHWGPLVLDFGKHQGQPLGVTVNQGCADPVDPNTTNNGGYTGIPTGGTGTYDPAFGGYTYYTPLVFASKGGLNSLIAVQNLGIECTSLEIYLKDPDNCLRPIIGDVLSLAPGERIAFDPNGVAGPDWMGSAWIRATQPLAVAVATQGPNHLTIYNGVPGDVYNVGFSLGSQVNYAPLSYSEYQGWDSAIAVQNLSAVYAAKVKVYFLDRGGDIITTLVDWVCPRGNQLFFLPVIANIPGNWVGSARVESQEWVTPGGPRNDPPRVQSVMLLERWSDPARTSRREAIAYNLLTEQVAFDWQLGILNGGTTSGSAVIAIPLVAKGNRGVTSEIGITNLVPKPGFTDFAIYLYDQNGLLDHYCQKLNEKQVEYIDLNAQGFLSRSFLGSAVISAVFWEHDVFDATGAFQRNLVGLGAVVVERIGSTQGAADVPGDESKGYEGIPVGKPFCEDRAVCAGVPER